MCSFAVQQSLGTKVYISPFHTSHAPPKVKATLPCSYCDVQGLSCSLGILSKKMAYEGPTNPTPSSSNGVKLKQKMLLAAFHVGCGEQRSIPVMKQATSQVPSKETHYFNGSYSAD